MRFFRSLLLTLPLIVASGAAMSDSGSGQDPLTRVDSQLAAGQPAHAVETLRALVGTEPQNFEARVKLGGLQLSIGEYTPAIETLQVAAGLNPDSARPFIGLALAYLHSGDLPLAYAAVEEALRREPDKKAALQPLVARLDQKMSRMGLMTGEGAAGAHPAPVGHAGH